MKNLSPRQGDMLKFIIDHIDQHGYPPTRREMADALEVTGLNGIASHIIALQHKGYIGLIDKGSRAIKVLRFPDGRAAEVSVREPALSNGAEQEASGESRGSTEG